VAALEEELAESARKERASSERAQAAREEAKAALEARDAVLQAVDAGDGAEAATEAVMAEVFALREEAEHGQSTLRIDARVLVSHDDYPRMKPAEMRYSLHLSRRPGGGATNAEAVLVGHSCVYDAATGDCKHFEIRKPEVSFIAFGASRATARHVWLSLAPLAEFDGGVKLSQLAADEAAARAKVMAEDDQRLER